MRCRIMAIKLLEWKTETIFATNLIIFRLVWLILLGINVYLARKLFLNNLREKRLLLLISHFQREN